MVEPKNPSYTPVNQTYLDADSSTVFFYERLARVAHETDLFDVIMLSTTNGSNRSLIGILAEPMLPDSAARNIEYPLKPGQVAKDSAIPLKPITTETLENLCTALTKQGFSVSPHPQSGMYTVR